MNKISQIFCDAFSIKSQRGVTAVEYGLLAAGVAIAIATAVALLGTNLTNLFNSVATRITSP
jgi:pilus assembly protein Flp/PilA